jgi:hypothetical protein
MKRQVELGLFDPQRLKRYRNGTDLANIIRDALGAYRQTAAALFLDQRQPLYFQYHLAKIKFATSYFVCVKQQNWVRVSMTMRQFGYPRSCLPRSQVGSSVGILLSLLPPTDHGRRGAQSACLPACRYRRRRRSIRCPAKVWRAHHSVRPTRWSKRCPQPHRNPGCRGRSLATGSRTPAPDPAFASRLPPSRQTFARRHGS